MDDKKMEVFRIEDAKEETGSSSTSKTDSEAVYMEQMSFKCNTPVKESGLKSMKHEINVKEENNSYGTEMSIKSETIIDIKNEVNIENELSYELLESKKNEDYKDAKQGIDSSSTARTGSGAVYMEQKTFNCNIPVKESGLDTMKYEKNVKEENNFYGTEMSTKSETIIDIKDEVNIENELSYELLESTKTEDYKDAKEETDGSSTARAGSEVVYMKRMTTRCNDPVKEVDFESMKYEYNVEEETININDKVNKDLELNYDLVESIKTADYKTNYGKEYLQRSTISETFDIKDETTIEENDLNYQQQKSMKIEDYRIDCGKEYMQRRATQCYVLLNRLDIDHRHYVNDLETMKRKQNFEKEDTSGTEVNMRKQNAVKESQHNCYKYGTGNARHSNSEVDIEQYEPLLHVYKAKDESPLQTHIKVTHRANVKYFKCEFCEYMTKYKHHLKTHFATKHSKIAELYQCFNCKFKTNNKTRLVRHCRLLHYKGAKWYQCASCNFKTKYKYNLLQHHSLKHDDEAEILHCGLCNYITKRKQNLLLHHISKHDDAAEIFRCELCDYKTKIRSYLLHHHRVRHDNATKTYQCKLCDYKTKITHSLLRHHKVKHDDAAEIFQCVLCKYKTKRKDYFLKHNRFKHDDAADIFHCELCDFKTKWKQGLRLHHRFKHVDAAEIFDCDMCDYKTKWKQSLLQHHRLKHDDAAEFLHCKLCDSKTKYKSSLLAHYRLKHDDSGEIFPIVK